MTNISNLHQDLLNIFPRIECSDEEIQRAIDSTQQNMNALRYESMKLEQAIAINERTNQQIKELEDKLKDKLDKDKLKDRNLIFIILLCNLIFIYFFLLFKQIFSIVS